MKKYKIVKKNKKNANNPWTTTQERTLIAYMFPEKREEED
jgi:hypothetical protein